MVKKLTCNAGDPASIPRSGRSPWRRDLLLTPAFLPGEFRRQRNLAGYGCRVRHHWVTHTPTHTWGHLVIVLHLKVKSLVVGDLQGLTLSTSLTSLTLSSTLLPTSPASTTNCIAWCLLKIPGMLCHCTFTLSLPSVWISLLQDAYTSQLLICFCLCSDASLSLKTTLSPYLTSQTISCSLPCLMLL